MDAGGGFNDATSAMGAYISRAADGSFLSIMDRAQWGYALFDAGCWGYASVTISTLAPLLFVRRIPSDPMLRWQQGVWEASKQGMQNEERAVEGFLEREADSVDILRESGSIWPRYSGRGRTDVFQGHMLEGQDEFRPLEMHIENGTKSSHRNVTKCSHRNGTKRARLEWNKMRGVLENGTDCGG